METEIYWTAPVETVRVTRENMAEVAKWCGGRVVTIPSPRDSSRTETYVWVPTSASSVISEAYPGMFVTRRPVLRGGRDAGFAESWAVFRADYFSKNYFQTSRDALTGTWGRHDPSVVASYERQLELFRVPAEKPDEVTINIMHGGSTEPVFSKKPTPVQFAKMARKA